LSSLYFFSDSPRYNRGGSEKIKRKQKAMASVAEYLNKYSYQPSDVNPDEHISNKRKLSDSKSNISELMEICLNTNRLVTEMHDKMNATDTKVQNNTIRMFKITIHDRDVVDAYIKTRKNGQKILVIVFIHEAAAKRVLVEKHSLSNDKSKIYFNEMLTWETQKIRFEAVKAHESLYP
jgi:hypothetical protein